jgi:2-polyprenyl-6-methoxyphenol hydroxylase-like FAD-dependent oxidoreductase
MLESGVRRRLLQLRNVRLRERCDVLEPVFDLGQGRVTGVRIREAANGTQTIRADLVVDASGRGSSSPTWLATQGYVQPRLEQVKVNISYMTRQYRRVSEHLSGKTGAVIAACHPDWRFGAILAQEHGRWIVSLGGYLGDQVPASDAGFLEFARSLQKPEIFDVLKDAEPLCPLAPYQFTANVRRHYEELSRFPEGFLVFGDALCSFNPVYGQGMTVACLESLILRDCLASGMRAIAGRFFRKAGRLIDIPWQIAVGSDLQHPKIDGKRGVQTRFINWYIAKLFRAAQNDPLLSATFLNVANLIQGPDALLKPEIVWRVSKGNRPWAHSKSPVVQCL